MHKPVLISRINEFLNPKPGGVYVDATFGGGGYTKEILDSCDCKVIAFDRDPDAILRAQSFKENYTDRFEIHHSPFSQIDQYVFNVDGIVFDFGVSSFQLDQPERGFSFKKDGPLDMRMSKSGKSVAEVVNTYSESDLADIIYTYGDERQSRRIARAIVHDRVQKKYTTTNELAELIRRIVKRNDGIDPATRTFQALRIYVNNELIEIDETLRKTLPLLSDQARIVAVTFHSLEDRLVKNFFKNHIHPTDCKKVKIITRQPILPSELELAENPRARSAKLRAAEIILG